MDLHATEVTRWSDGDLCGLAFGNDHYCFVVQCFESGEPGYFLSTEDEARSYGGIVDLSLQGDTLLLLLSESASMALGVDSWVAIDLSGTGTEGAPAAHELSEMVGLELGQDVRGVVLSLT